MSMGPELHHETLSQTTTETIGAEDGGCVLEQGVWGRG